MSDLRRRIFGVGSPAGTPDSSREPSPAPPRKNDATEERNVVPASMVKTTKPKRKAGGLKRRNAWIFGLGGLFGIGVALVFAAPKGGMDKLVEFAGLQDMSLDSLLDVLPAGMIKDVQGFQVGLP